MHSHVRMRVILPLCALVLGCSHNTAPAETSPDAPVTSVDAAVGEDRTDAPASTDAAVDAPPPPAFVISGSYWSAGHLAIDGTGLRPTYQLSGETRSSAIRFRLHSPETGFCYVSVRPAFVEFGTAIGGGRMYKTLVLNPSAGAIVQNECGVADAYVMPAFVAMNLIEVGFARAQEPIFTPPYLDMVSVRAPWVPSYATYSLDEGRALAHPMAADGTVDPAVTIQPAPGTVLPALYEFEPI